MLLKFLIFVVYDIITNPTYYFSRWHLYIRLTQNYPYGKCIDIIIWEINWDIRNGPIFFLVSPRECVSAITTSIVTEASLVGKFFIRCLNNIAKDESFPKFIG